MVARVVDGRTFVTTAGHTVRLAGVLVPEAFEAGARSGAWPLEEDARRALADLITGKQVVATAISGRDGLDRYGRSVAQVHVVDVDGWRWVQGALIDAGLAVAVPEPAGAACHAAAIAREELARERKAGVFATPVWRVLDLSREDLSAETDGAFQIVTGVVQRIWRQRNGTVVLVRGHRTRGDPRPYTPSVEVVLDTDALRALAPGKDSVRGLLRRTVEVRGWFERREAGNSTAATRVRGVRFLVRTGAAGGIRVIETRSVEPLDLVPTEMIETGMADGN